MLLFELIARPQVSPPQPCIAPYMPNIFVILNVVALQAIMLLTVHLAAVMLRDSEGD
jgi:hypothetical protein